MPIISGNGIFSGVTLRCSWDRALSAAITICKVFANYLINKRLKHHKLMSMHFEIAESGEVEEACQDHSKWESRVSAYTSGRKV